ncbi:MAG: hypothetical protein JKY37_01275, partial [Nannocystaceae bacterium]|nr:hypothetical protein [Nannocystaceae bacterium]
MKRGAGSNPRRVGNFATFRLSVLRDTMRLGLLLPCLCVLSWVGCRPVATEGPAPGPVAEPAPRADVVSVLKPWASPPRPSINDEGNDSPGIAGFGPTAVVDVYPQVFVRFSHAMQPVVEGPAAPKFEFDPPVDGVMSWPSPYVAVFDPNDSLPMSTAFSVHVTGSLVAAIGESVDVDTTFGFETERPELTVATSDFEEGAVPWNTSFRVFLSEEGVALRLKGHVRAVARDIDGKGEPVTVPVRIRRLKARETRMSWVDEELVVSPRGHWPANSEIELIVDESLPLGTLTLGRAVSGTLVTKPGLRAEVACWTEYDDGCGPGPVVIRLDQTLRGAQLSRIEVTPKPRHLKVRFLYRERQGNEIEISGDFKVGRRYRVRTLPGFVDVHGQPLVEPIDQVLDFVEPPPMLTLVASHGTLRAKGKRTVGLETRWVKRVRIRAAVLEDQQLMNQFMREPKDLRIPDKPRRLHEEVIDIDITGERGWGSVEIDLAAVAADERRPVLVEVRPVAMMPDATGRPTPGVARAIYQQSDLGAMSLLSPARSLTRVTSLETNHPIAGVRADLYRATKTVNAPLLAHLRASGDDGIIELPKSSTLPKRGLVFVHHGEDRFAARIGSLYSRRRPAYQQHISPYAYADQETVLSRVATERPLYRPGDNVYVVGWSAVSTNRAHVGLRPLPTGTPVELTLTDLDGREVSRRQVAVKASGKYWGRLAIPTSGRLGYYEVNAKIGDETFQRSIRVKDFKTPTFSVEMSVDRGDVVAGDTVSAGLAASYFFGGAVPIQRLRRVLSCGRAYFRPPNLDPEWTLAQFSNTDDVPYSVSGPDGTVEIPAADAARGRARLALATDFVPAMAAYRCRLSVAARDISMMEVGAQSSWIVHPEAYLAVRRPPGPLHAGDRVSVPIRTLGYAGSRRSDRVAVEIVRTQWKRSDGGWKEEPTPVAGCTTTTTLVGPDATCALPPLRRGRYEVSARRTTGEGPRPTARVSFWVGSRARPRPYSAPERLEIEVVPAAPRPGEVVEVRLTAPYATGDGVVAFLAGGVRRLIPFSLADGAATLTVDVDQSWVPTIEIKALLPRPDMAASWARLATATQRVDVREHGRDLRVEVDAPELASPNEIIEIKLKVRDDKGGPTAANVSVWAVDEAVLSLQEPVIPDLVRAFMVRRDPLTSVESEYGSVIAPYVQRSDPY